MHLTVPFFYPPPLLSSLPFSPLLTPPPALNTQRYKISSKGAVDCSQMDLSRGGNFSGLVVFIVFLVLIGAVLAATTFIFYKRSQVPGMSAMPDTYEQL